MWSLQRFIFQLLFVFLCIGQFSLIYAQNVDSVATDTMVVSDSLQINKEISDTSLQSKDGLDAQVHYVANDSIVMNLKERRAYLYNQASIEFKDITVKADFIIVDFDKKEIFARGVKDTTGKIITKTEFIDGDKTYEADSMKYNFNTRKGLSIGIKTVESDGYVYGNTVVRDSNESIYVKGARFTTCDQEHPHFWISADKFKIVPQKQVVTGPANLVVEGVKTPFIIPFGFFPLQDKQSKGLILPSYGESDQRGFSFEGIGYYTPINPYVDLALTADLYFRGSWGLHLASNYRKRYKYYGDLGVHYNYNKFGDEFDPNFRVSRDFRVNWRFNKDAKSRPGQNFSADVNFVSSDFLRNNSDNPTDIVSNTITSGISFSQSFLNNRFNFRTNARVNQNTAKKEVSTNFPEFAFTMARWVPFSKPGIKSNALKNLGFSYSGNFRNELRVKEDNFFKASTWADSLRYGVSHAIPISTSMKALKYLTISPSFNYSEIWYWETTEQMWLDESDTLVENPQSGFGRLGTYSGNVSLTTIIYGRKLSSKGKIRGIQHVLRPQISARWSPDYSKDPKYGWRKVQTDTAGTIEDYNIFSKGIFGAPTSGATAALNFSLGNNLEMKVKSNKDTVNDGIKKIKLLENFSASGGYNFLADSLNWSNIALNGNTALFDGLIRLNFGGAIDLYAIDSTENGRIYRHDRFQYEKTGQWARFTSGNLSVSTNFNPEARKKEYDSKYGSYGELAYINAYRDQFVDFSLPWSLSMNYNLRYNKSGFEKGDLTQSITFNGDVKLSEKWKIAVSSGYDISQKQLTLTRIDLFRNLHCWEFSFGWIPTGFRRSFEFTIRAKSPTLADLKLNRRGFWYDN